MCTTLNGSFVSLNNAANIEKEKCNTIQFYKLEIINFAFENVAVNVMGIPKT